MSAKNKVVRAWVHQHINDHYVKSAVAKGYRSRAAYKLLEIDQKFSLFKNVKRVVDLGCAPGSWLQVAVEKIGKTNLVVGVDLLDIEPVGQVSFIQGDFTEDEVLARLINAIGDNSVDLVISDMAPNLSGVKNVDQARSGYLIELALDFCQKYLIENGNCLIKAFHGAQFDSLVKLMREQFLQVVIYKPDASRSQSKEIYLVGLGKKQV